MFVFQHVPYFSPVFFKHILRLSRMLAKHNHTPSIGHSDETPKAPLDQDQKRLAVILLGTLLLGIVAWGSWGRPTYDTLAYRWVVFATVLISAAGFYVGWRRTEDSPIRARRIMSLLGILASAAAFGFAMVVNDRLQTYLIELAVYLLLVAVVSLRQQFKLRYAAARETDDVEGFTVDLYLILTRYLH